MHVDSELLERWRGGDATAGGTLLSRHFDSLYRFFRTKCGDDADELVQATMLACVDARDKFRGEASFRTYLFAIARQKLNRFFTTKPRFDPLETSVAAIATTVGAKLDHAAQSDALAAAMRQLPLEWQTLLELHYWEGMDTNALAVIFEVPVGTIRVWMHRARVKLKGLLDDQRN